MSSGYKILTHDLCSPLQGGQPIFDGSTPHELLAVELDRSDADCGAGWHYCPRPEQAARIAGLWPDGRPSRLFEVEPVGDHVERGDKCRAEGLRILRQVGIEAAIEPLSALFGEHARRMAREQVAWHTALARPRHDAARVRRGLRTALDARDLDWKLRRFDTARAAWDARAARAAWDAWAARAARAARDARAAWAARAARAAWDAWAAWNAWDAWDARDALTVTYAALQGWIDGPPDQLTRGLRSAYRHGLAIALPTGLGELGWAMEVA